jgi:hypothetical protein
MLDKSLVCEQPLIEQVFKKLGHRVTIVPDAIAWQYAEPLQRSSIWDQTIQVNTRFVELMDSSGML